MTKKGVVSYQMPRLDETNTLVPFSFLLLHPGKSYWGQKRSNFLKIGLFSIWEFGAIWEFMRDSANILTPSCFSR